MTLFHLFTIVEQCQTQYYCYYYYYYYYYYYRVSLIALPNQSKVDPRRVMKARYTFSMATGTVELFRECSP